MLKIFIIACGMLLIFAGCDVRRHDKLATNSALTKQVELKDPTTVPIIDSAYDFGQVADGEIVVYNYRFKNTGTKPLIITNASATSGCTVLELQQSFARFVAVTIASGDDVDAGSSAGNVTHQPQQNVERMCA